jgi:hypothetical protein
LFSVERPTAPGADSLLPFTRSEYEALRRETGIFSDASAMVRPVRARMAGRPVSSALVTGNFFQMLGVQAALGRTLMPDDDEQGRPVIVLSHQGWNKLFGGDASVVGRSVRVNGRPYEIVGVMPGDFRGLAIGPPDYWGTLALVGQFRDAYAGRENEARVDVVGRLKPGLSPESAAAALNTWASRRVDVPPSRAERASASLAVAFGGGGKPDTTYYSGVAEDTVARDRCCHARHAKRCRDHVALAVARMRQRCAQPSNGIITSDGNAQQVRGLEHRLRTDAHSQLSEVRVA